MAVTGYQTPRLLHLPILHTRHRPLFHPPVPFRSFALTPPEPTLTMGRDATQCGPLPGLRSGRTLTMIEFVVTYPGLVFIGLSLLVVLDTVSGNLPPAALVPFALGTVLAVILL